MIPFTKRRYHNMKRCILSSLVVLVFGAVGLGQDTPTQFESDGVWEWLFGPAPVEIKVRPSSTEGAEEQAQWVALLELDDAELSPQLVTLADRVPLLVCGSGGDSRTRLVAFDEDKERLPSGSNLACGAPGATIHLKEVRLGTKTLKYLGVEHLSPANQKRQAAEAQKELIKEGIRLSYPVEGESFPFAFGRPGKPAIESKQLLGKVVLIQWWASW
jgi:hypothetical protein